MKFELMKCCISLEEALIEEKKKYWIIVGFDTNIGIEKIFRDRGN